MVLKCFHISIHSVFPYRIYTSRQIKPIAIKRILICRQRMLMNTKKSLSALMPSTNNQHPTDLRVNSE